MTLLEMYKKVNRFPFSITTYFYPGSLFSVTDFDILNGTFRIKGLPGSTFYVEYAHVNKNATWFEFTEEELKLQFNELTD